MTRFDSLPTLFEIDEKFAIIWEKCHNHEDVGDFHILRGYLYHGNKLCIPKTYLNDYLFHEIHAIGLMAHIGRDKIISLRE